MSSHTKHVYHQRPEMPRKQLITRIGYGAVIDSHTSMSAGVNIGDNVMVGYGSVVTGDLLDLGIYFGNPAKFFKEVPANMVIPKPMDYKEHKFPKEMLKNYLPYY